ncbi:MAG: hypothetical protein EU529_05845 [Promethearchaeota archaeon]|nr:MAG: hypothetical protein EU529_05845 [Candidatus Lokiarchaeota archaeon]
MVSVKEIKISVHRKYTKDYQSYGFRVGIMGNVEERENIKTAYYNISKILDKMVDIENKKIWELWKGEIP